MPKRILGNVDYAKGTVPKDYKCDECDAHGVKLWREYQTSAHVTELVCADCAEAGEKKHHKEGWESPYKKGEGDQIGWYIPAVPVEGDDTYWGCTSIPQAGYDWWNKLPTRL